MIIIQFSRGENYMKASLVSLLLPLVEVEKVPDEDGVVVLGVQHITKLEISEV